MHDGDGSDFGDAGPAGSKAIEDVFFRYFQENALPAETTPFDGGSDYDAFLSAGIPGGGLFTGDVEKKTQAQAQSFGGAAGKDLDPCYHEACDTIANTNPELLTGNVRRPGLRHRGLRDGQDRLNTSFALTLTSKRCPVPRPFAVAVGRGSRMSMAPAPMSAGCPAARIFPSSPGLPKVRNAAESGS